MYDFEAVRPQLREVCQQWGITRLTAFGSSLPYDFHSASDVDLIIGLPQDSRVDLFDMVNIKEQFEQVFGRAVDLLTERSVTHMRNPFRKQSILSLTRDLYVSR